MFGITIRNELFLETRNWMVLNAKPSCLQTVNLPAETANRDRRVGVLHLGSYLQADYREKFRLLATVGNRGIVGRLGFDCPVLKGLLKVKILFSSCNISINVGRIEI